MDCSSPRIFSSSLFIFIFIICRNVENTRHLTLNRYLNGLQRRPKTRILKWSHAYASHFVCADAVGWQISALKSCRKMNRYGTILKCQEGCFSVFSMKNLNDDAHSCPVAALIESAMLQEFGLQLESMW